MRRWRPRLRTVLLAANLIAVALPLAGIVLLRLYENELIRQTEAELLAQGALIAAMYRDALVASGAELSRHGRAIEAPDTFDPELHPIPARLDLARDRVRGRAEAARPATEPADRLGLEAGRRIGPTMKRAQRITLAGIRVVDAEGRVVATTRSELRRSLAHREEVARALRGEVVSLFRERVSDEPPPPPWSISRGTQVRVFVALPVIEAGRLLGAVVLSRTPMSLSQALYVNRFQLLLLVVVVLGLVLGGSLLTSRLVAIPVRALIRQTRRATEGDPEAMRALDRPGTREVAELSEAFAGLTRRLSERADYIATFASSVSHEFKTPLTSIRGTVELLRDHLESMSGEERERFLAMLDADAARLQRLVGRLHELARADVSSPGQERVSVRSVLEALRERWKEGGRDVELDADGLEDSDVVVPVGSEVLETIVTNLVDNALQHGGESVAVTLRSAGPAAAESGGEWVAIRVADDGAGISAANRGRVFDTFFTTAREQGGSGLGLPIVRAFARAHGGDVQLLESPEGAIFEVVLPIVAA